MPRLGLLKNPIGNIGTASLLPEHHYRNQLINVTKSVSQTTENAIQPVLASHGQARRMLRCV
jgi:hypothetical protein